MGKVLYLPTATCKANSEAIRQAMKPRRRWNWRRAAGNLLTVAAIVGVGALYAWMIFLPWWAGSVW